MHLTSFLLVSVHCQFPPNCHFDHKISLPRNLPCWANMFQILNRQWEWKGNRSSSLREFTVKAKLLILNLNSLFLYPSYNLPILNICTRWNFFSFLKTLENSLTGIHVFSSHQHFCTPKSRLPSRHKDLLLT